MISLRVSVAFATTVTTGGRTELWRDLTAALRCIGAQVTAPVADPLAARDGGFGETISVSLSPTILSTALSLARQWAGARSPLLVAEVHLPDSHPGDIQADRDVGQQDGPCNAAETEQPIRRSGQRSRTDTRRVTA